MDAVSLQVHQSVREAEEATGTIQGIEITAQDGTNYKVVFEKATGDDAALAATIDTDTNSIVVTLGTDGSGDLDAAKNTLTLVTSAIDGVTGLGAVEYGSSRSPNTAQSDHPIRFKPITQYGSTRSRNTL